MNDLDVRDDRLAELLDRAVGDVQASTTSDTAVRRGDRRRALRLAASFVTALVFVVVAIWASAITDSRREPAANGSAIVDFASPDAPWTFAYPSAWSVSTVDHAGPELIANVLRTTVSNVPIPQDAEFGPNSSPNASSLFGDAGVVVLVERVWSPAMQLGGNPEGPGSFADDAQNPGWTFRERARCDGTLCFHVIEWLGPASSAEDRATAATIADSAHLGDVERWTETDGITTTLHDEVDLFTVTYPSDWSVPDEPINDWVCSPFEIVTVATYAVEPGGEAVTDFQLPSHAVDGLGPNDILIWVNEAGNACGGKRLSDSGSAFPERPERFGPLNVCGDFDRLCPSDGRDMVPGIRGWWIAFKDAGRAFYVFVGMGEDAFANEARAQQTWDVLDSLRFLPR